MCFIFWCSRLVVWCLWSIQFEWDLLPTRSKLKSLQWNKMVLLERLWLLTEDHYNDDQTGRLLRFTLNCHSSIFNKAGREMCQKNGTRHPNKTQNPQRSQSKCFHTMMERHILCAFIHVLIWIKWLLAKRFAKQAAPWQRKKALDVKNINTERNLAS